MAAAEVGGGARALADDSKSSELRRFVAAVCALPLSTWIRLLICIMARSLWIPKPGPCKSPGDLPVVDVDAKLEVMTTEFPDAWRYEVSVNSGVRMDCRGSSSNELSRGLSPLYDFRSAYNVQARARRSGTGTGRKDEADGRRKDS